MKSMKQVLPLWKSKFDYYPGVSLLLLAVLTAAFISFLIGFVGVMLSEIYEWSIEKLILDLLGVERKYEALRFLGIGMGGIVLVAQAVISYKRAKAMEDAAKAQAKAMELQAKANENTEKGQRQERLKNAIEHLGHDSISIRMGGAYELFHLAQDTKELRQTVLDILCAHIRQTTSDKKYQEDQKSKPSEEIQSLLTLLFVQEHDVFKGHHINLRESWLNGANLNNARLKGARFDGAHLIGTKLGSASLQGSVLFDTQLQAAALYVAELQGACLCGAELQGAPLDGAKMQGVTSLPSISSSIVKRVRDGVGRDSQFETVIFEGGFTQDKLDALIEDQPEEVAEELRRRLTRHIGQPRSYTLPENSSVITGSYTSEEAEQWIAEYKEAVSEVQDEGDS